MDAGRANGEGHRPTLLDAWKRSGQMVRCVMHRGARGVRSVYCSIPQAEPLSKGSEPTLPCAPASAFVILVYWDNLCWMSPGKSCPLWSKLGQAAIQSCLKNEAAC